jgi:hypothetical protein
MRLQAQERYTKRCVSETMGSGPVKWASRCELVTSRGRREARGTVLWPVPTSFGMPSTKAVSGGL